MSEELDALVQEMRELTDTVKNAKADPATLDFETVKDAFQEQIDELVEAKFAEKMESTPRRRGMPVYPAMEGAVHGLIKGGNRYAKAVRDIAEDGYSKTWTNRRLKAADLWLAHQVLEAQFNLKSAQRMAQGEPAAPPSDELKAAIKALTSTGSATGDELVPNLMADELWQDFFLASKIVASIETVPMPSNPFDYPLGLGDVTWYKGTENTATTASDPATGKSILTATELVTEQNWSYTLDEDAIIAMAPGIRQRLSLSGGEIIDDFAYNADATNAATGHINEDDADPADTDIFLSAGQDGIRHQWLVDNTAMGVNAGGDALSDADILSALALMGKYAVTPEQCVMVADISTYLKGLLNLDGVQTLDKYGLQAVLLTGELARYRGVPIVVSASARKTEADGKLSTTAGNNTLGQISIFNTLMWYAGFRRQLLIEVDKDIQKRMYIMVSSIREAIAAHGTRASATHTAGIRNILVS